MFAQEDKLIRAQQLYRSKNIEEAVTVIDSVILHPQTKNDFVTWSTRGYIYYELFKRHDKLKLHSQYRDTIVSSIMMSQNLKPDSVYLENNKRLLTTIANSCYNLSKYLLVDSTNYERSVIGYNNYKQIYHLVDERYNFTNKDVEYYLAVGSHFSDIFTKDNNNSKAEEYAKVALLKVLDLQPENSAALVNLGLLFYNHAVNLSKELEYGADFEKIDFVQENMVKLAKQSEQFIGKAFGIDPKNKKAVEALYYIYRMLNEIAKSDDFKVKCKDLGINVDQASK
jgi:hypothetical protein